MHTGQNSHPKEYLLLSCWDQVLQRGPAKPLNSQPRPALKVEPPSFCLSLIKFDLFYFILCVLSPHVFVNTMCMPGAQWRWAEDIRSLGTAVANSCESSWGFQEPNTSPLPEEWVFLATDPSLQSLNLFLSSLENTVLCAPVSWASNAPFLMPNSPSNDCRLSVVFHPLVLMETLANDNRVSKWFPRVSLSGTYFPRIVSDYAAFIIYILYYI